MCGKGVIDVELKTVDFSVPVSVPVPGSVEFKENGMESTVFGDVFSILVRQASPFFPSIFIAQEPQIPSLQDRRKDKEGSESFFILIKASKTIGPQSEVSTK